MDASDVSSSPLIARAAAVSVLICSAFLLIFGFRQMKSESDELRSLVAELLLPRSRYVCVQDPGGSCVTIFHSQFSLGQRPALQVSGIHSAGDRFSLRAEFSEYQVLDTFEGELHFQNGARVIAEKKSAAEPVVYKHLSPVGGVVSEGTAAGAVLLAGSNDELSIALPRTIATLLPLETGMVAHEITEIRFHEMTQQQSGPTL